jgi:hypothetical protein
MRLLITFLLISTLKTWGQVQVKGSPKGTMLEHKFASSFNYYFFCENGSLAKDCYYFDIVEFGTWSMNGDTIKLNFNKISGLRGIGEAKNHPTGANLDYYDEMVNFVEYIDKEDYLLWSKIQKDISKDESSNFKIWNANIDCSVIKFNMELPGDYFIASSKTLTKDELKKYSKQDLKLMRNEIYARYGYIFNSADLKTYFEKKKWYEPKIENVDKYLTETEKKNIATIKEIEM